MADQLASYNSPLRKTSIWYIKIAADLLAISVVNAILIYNKLHPGTKMKTFEGHQQNIIKKLLQVENYAPNPGPSSSLRQAFHNLTQIPRKANGKNGQKLCTLCYKKLNEEISTKIKQEKKLRRSQLNVFCAKKMFCLKCFNEDFCMSIII